MHCGASRVWPIKRQRGFIWDSVNFLWEKVQKHGIVLVEQWKQLGVVLLGVSNKKNITSDEVLVLSEKKSDFHLFCDKTNCTVPGFSPFFSAHYILITGSLLKEKYNLS